jgi:hypothetical protein
MKMKSVGSAKVRADAEAVESAAISLGRFEAS